MKYEYALFECGDCGHHWPYYLPSEDEGWVSCPNCAKDSIMDAALDRVNGQRVRPKLVTLLIPYESPIALAVEE